MGKAEQSAVLSNKVHLVYIMLWKPSQMFQHHLHSTEPVTKQSEN